MMQNLEIRQLLPSDTEYLKACAELSAQCLPEEAWSFTSFLSETEKNFGYVLVILENQAVKGFLTASCILDSADLTTIAVSPECRKKGFAGKLLEALFQKIGSAEIFLEVRESNLPARNFYEKYAFHQVGIRKNFYQNPDENAILMKRGGN
jgi:ribosomal-protein-alanine N-acetyltransferase